MPCASVCERNLLADTAKIVDKNKICKRKDEFCRKVVTDGLSALGYDASICKSHWEKSPSYPAGTLSLYLSEIMSLCIAKIYVSSVWLLRNMLKILKRKATISGSSASLPKIFRK